MTGGSQDPPRAEGKEMNQDLSYLRTEYAREKMIEEYRNEEKQREAKHEQVRDESRQSDRVVGWQDV